MEIYSLKVVYCDDIAKYPEWMCADMRMNEVTKQIERTTLFEVETPLNERSQWKIKDSIKRAFVGMVERVFIRPAFVDERIEYVRKQLA